MPSRRDTLELTPTSDAGTASSPVDAEPEVVGFIILREPRVTLFHFTVTQGRMDITPSDRMEPEPDILALLREAIGAATV
jgi:hypothetical protein